MYPSFRKAFPFPFPFSSPSFFPIESQHHLLSSSTGRNQLLPLDTLPLRKQTTRPRDPAHRNRQHKCPRNGTVITLQHTAQLVRGRDFFHIGRAGGDDGGRVDILGEEGNFAEEGVGEDVLGDGDGDGAAESIEKDC